MQKLLIHPFLVLLSLFGLVTAMGAPILPEPWKFEDLPIWDAGVRGGIPQVPVQRTISQNELGSAKNKAATIQSAIDSISTPGAVQLPEGDYLLNEALRLKSGVVLRGTGIDRTTLRFDLTIPETSYPFEMPAGGSIRFEGTQEGLGRPIPFDHLKGEQEIRTPHLEGLKAGDTIEIFSENDPHLLYTESRWKQPWAEQALAQLVSITSIAENGFTIDTPLRLNFYRELNPRFRKIMPIKFAGLESVSLVRIDQSPDSSVGFENALNCWVKDCESTMTTRGHVWINRSRFITVQGNEVHHAFSYGSGGSGYGLVAGNIAVDCLFENNIAHHLRHSLMAKKGSNGNVFAFNYSFERRREPAGENLLCDISLHGHYPHYNLFEGNVVQFVDISDHWGPTGPETTFFRNHIQERIAIRDYSNDMRILGNVLVNGGIDPDVTVRNISLIENTLLSKPDFRDTKLEEPLPASLYYKEKPDFWGELPWPSIGPGTDTQRKIFIPAQLRRQAR